MQPYITRGGSGSGSDGGGFEPGVTRAVGNVWSDAASNSNVDKIVSGGNTRR